MAKKRKKPFRDRALTMLRGLDDLKYDPDADFDAIVRSQSQLAIAAGLRKPAKRRKTLEQQIEHATATAQAREAREVERVAKLKRRNAAASKKRAAAKKADKA